MLSAGQWLHVKSSVLPSVNRSSAAVYFSSPHIRSLFDHIYSMSSFWCVRPQTNTPQPWSVTSVSLSAVCEHHSWTWHNGAHRSPQGHSHRLYSMDVVSMTTLRSSWGAVVKLRVWTFPWTSALALFDSYRCWQSFFGKKNCVKYFHFVILAA